MTAPAASTQDFADWLPPMLVKELRQGLKANEFMGVFVLAHVAMIALLGLRLDSGDTDSSENLDRMMWLALGTVLLVLMPLRGIAAISSEVQAGTLDLVQLTHLGSMRIVWEKWLALVSQTVLLVVAVLPYWVLRYYLGGVDIVQESWAVGWMLFASLPFTAVCMAISTAGRFVRLLVLVVLAIFIFMVGSQAISSLSRGASGDASAWIFLFAGTVSTAFALSVAAAGISAAAENASFRMRGIALLAVVVSMVGGWLDEWESGFAGTALILPVLAWAAVEAMTEQTCELPSVYIPWVRRGWVGRLAGRVFYPGWCSGLVFVLLITACLVVGALLDTPDRPEHLAVLMAHLGMAMLYPAVVLCALPRARHRHWIYVGIQAASLLWFAFMAFIAPNAALSTAVADAFTPGSAFLWSLEQSSNVTTGFLWDANIIVAAVVDTVILLFLYSRSRAEFRKIRQLEQQAILSLSTRPAGTTIELNPSEA